MEQKPICKQFPRKTALPLTMDLIKRRWRCQMRCRQADAQRQSSRTSRHRRYRPFSLHLPRFVEPALPGRRLRAKAALGAGAEPIAELRRHVAERAFDAEFQRRVHRPVRIVEDFAADCDQVGLLVAQYLFGLVAMDDE